MNSWTYQLSQAKTHKAMARVHLERALGRGSKRLIAADIEAAMSHLEMNTPLFQALADAGEAYCQEGLHNLARIILEAIPGGEQDD